MYDAIEKLHELSMIFWTALKDPTTYTTKSANIILIVAWIIMIIIAMIIAKQTDERKPKK